MVILPLKNQIVHCFKCIYQQKNDIYNKNYDQRFYYNNPINIYNRINNNKLFNISNHNIDEEENYKDNFQQNNNKRKLQLGQGDILLQGRLGQYIKFGSKQNLCNLSNLKIGIDDENYFLIGNEITPQISTNVLDNYKQNYDSIDVLINSQNIIFNSSLYNILFSSNKDLILSANNNIDVISKFFKLQIENNININSNKTININSNKIIFNDGQQSMVNGNKLIQLLTQILDQISKITVITSMGLSSTPSNVLQFNMLKNKLNNCLNKKIFI